MTTPDLKALSEAATQGECDWCVDGLQADGETPCQCQSAPRVYTAAELDAAIRKAKEDIAAWIETQRNDIPATGGEFAAAIRARATEESKT